MQGLAERPISQQAGDGLDRLQRAGPRLDRLYLENKAARNDLGGPDRVPSNLRARITLLNAFNRSPTASGTHHKSPVRQQQRRLQPSEMERLVHSYQAGVSIT